jgi:hypothetical protein
MAKVSDTMGEKLNDLANIAAGAMIFGQFMAGGEIPWWVMGVGFVIVAGLYIAGGLLLKWARRKGD